MFCTALWTAEPHGSHLGVWLEMDSELLVSHLPYFPGIPPPPLSSLSLFSFLSCLFWQSHNNAAHGLILFKVELKLEKLSPV